MPRLLGRVAMASVIFDAVLAVRLLRMSTVAFTAQSLGSGEVQNCAPSWCADLSSLASPAAA